MTIFDTGIDMTPIPDITEAPEERHGRQATSADLYWRWERQQWSVQELDVSRDYEAWQQLRPFYRNELIGALAELEVGEVCVTETLGALVESAADLNDRIYLSTQLADEARHVRFFQGYLAESAGLDVDEPGGQEKLDDSTDYAHDFAPVLRGSTTAARSSSAGDLSAWYAAVVYYHIITEGVLAATALRTTRELVKTLPLPALAEGLTNVIRDESRHVSFGIGAVRIGVDAGYAEPIWQAYQHGINLAATVLIGPRRQHSVPAIPVARRYRKAQFDNQVSVARERIVKQLRLIGLSDRLDAAAALWERACDAALDSYMERWNAPHPLRAGA